MTNAQVFFAIAGLITGQTIFVKMYIDAKIDPLKEQVDLLVQYMISHEGRISRLEERTGGPATEKKAS